MGLKAVTCTFIHTGRGLLRVLKLMVGHSCVRVWYPGCRAGCSTGAALRSDHGGLYSGWNRHVRDSPVSHRDSRQIFVDRAYVPVVQTRWVGLASSAILVVALHKPNRAGKWQKCNLVPCMASVGQRHGLAMNWVDRPRTSADERGVVCSPRCRDCV